MCARSRRRGREVDEVLPLSGRHADGIAYEKSLSTIYYAVYTHQSGHELSFLFLYVLADAPVVVYASAYVLGSVQRW